MKKLNILFITTIVILLSISCATINPSEVKGMTKIVEAPGASKDELFVKASSWLVDAFNSAKSVIQFSDKEAGVIKGKYRITFPQFLETGECEATFTVECKDGKCRLIIDDPYNFRADDIYSTRITNMTKEGYESVTNDINALCLSFEKYLKEEHDVSW